MKKEIHPKYYPKATVKCTCGNTFKIGATQQVIETESCSKCHPFYTGKERDLDKVDRVQKFKARLAKKQPEKKKKKTKKKAKKKKKDNSKNKNGS